MIKIEKTSLNSHIQLTLFNYYHSILFTHSLSSLEDFTEKKLCKYEKKTIKGNLHYNDIDDVILVDY